MSPLLSDAEALKLGAATVDRLYFGATKIWPVDTWTPLSLSGLVVWLDAADVGTITSQWPDKSGLGHHGTIVGSPAPTVRTNALNTKPVVRFKPNEGRVRGTSGIVDADAALGGYNWTVVYVGRMVGPTVGRVYTATYPPPNMLVGFHTYGYDWMYENGFINDYVPWGGAIPPTPWKLYSATASHTGSAYAVQFFINGVQSGVTGSSGGGMGNTYNLSGYSATGTEETCDCEVAEVVVYNRRLSDTDRATVEGYLRMKWGL